MSNSLSTDHSKAVLESEGIAEGKGTGSSRADRLCSFDPGDFELPTGEEEEWRFTPMKRLAPFFETLDAAQAEVLVSAGSAESISREDERVGLVGRPEDITGALAWQAAERVHFVDVAGEAPDTMIAIDAPEGMSVAQLLILAEEGAKGTVVV